MKARDYKALTCAIGLPCFSGFTNVFITCYWLHTLIQIKTAALSFVLLS